MCCEGKREVPAAWRASISCKSFCTKDDSFQLHWNLTLLFVLGRLILLLIRPKNVLIAISIYKLNDLGDIHILICSLFRAIGQCPPPRRWIIIYPGFEWHS